MYRKSLAALLAALSLAGCATPTQVSVEVTTDIPCDRFKGADVMVGTIDDIEKKKTASSSTVCEKKTETVNSLGSIVLIPTDTKTDEFTIKVVGGVDIEADKCRFPENASRCIIARRSLRFIPNAMLSLPIFLSSSCEGVPCTDRKNETCSLGVCVSAMIDDPKQCENAGVCDDDVLTGGDNPLPVGEPIACGRPSLIADDFETTKPLSHWVIEGEGAAQAEGTLVLTPSADPDGKVELRTDHAVNLDGDAITVKVPAMLDPASEARAYLAAEFDEKNRITIEQKKGMLNFLSTDMAGEPVGPSIAYDPKKHVWWEIRSTPHNIVLRTSPDGLDWNPGATIPRSSVASFIDRVNIVLGADAGGASPGSVSFDNLNQGRPVVEWCPIDPFEDTFDGGQTLPQWRVEQANENCSITYENMSFVLTAMGNGLTSCALRSRAAFDFRGKSLELKMDSFSHLEPNVNFALSVADDRGFGAEIGVRVSPQGVNVGMPVYYYLIKRETGGLPEERELLLDVMNMIPRFFRLGEKGGQLVLQVSETGDTWLDFPESDTGLGPGFKTSGVHVTILLEAFTELVQKQLTVHVADLSVIPTP